MSPSLPDMDKLKTQAESVNGTVVDTAIVSAMDGDLVVWRQDPDDRSKLVVVNRKPVMLEGNEVRGVTMMVYPPEDRIENKLTLIQETLGARFVSNKCWMVKKRKLLKKMSRRTPHNLLR